MLFALPSWAQTARVELPGFSIVLPAGQVAEHGNQPQAGNYRVFVQMPASGKLAAPYGALDGSKFLAPPARHIVVSWLDTRYSREEWLTLLVRPTVNAVRGPNARVMHDEDLGDGKFLAAVGNDKFSIALAYAPCGNKFSVNIIFSVSREFADQLAGARIAVDSIVCGANPGGTPIEAVVDLPKGFTRIDEPGQSYSNAEGDVLVVSYSHGDFENREERFQQIIGAMLGSSLGSTVSLNKVATLTHGGNVYRMSGGGEFDGSYIGTRYCPSLQTTLVGTWKGADQSVAIATQRLSSISCPVKSDPPVRVR